MTPEVSSVAHRARRVRASRQRSRSEAEFETALAVVGALHMLFDRSVIRLTEYNKLARTVYALYWENNELRKALRDLEQLTSSWSGSPTNNPEIVRARELLIKWRTRCVL